MRHRKSGRKLNRNSSHRKAMFRNMACSLFEHEPLITLAKSDSVANRRLAFSRLRNDDAVGKLFAELGPRYVERPGGYLRVLKCGLREGDKAQMAIVELVDRPEVDDVDVEDLVEEVTEE